MLSSKPRARDLQEYRFHFVHLYTRFSPHCALLAPLFALLSPGLVQAPFIHNNAPICSYSLGLRPPSHLASIFTLLLGSRLKQTRCAQTLKIIEGARTSRSVRALWPYVQGSAPVKGRPVACAPYSGGLNCLSQPTRACALLVQGP
jgi:hypothetical protein